MRITVIAVTLMLILSACATNPPSTIPLDGVPETGDSANGEALFTTQICIACHIEGATGAPQLAGLSERAGSIVEGQSAREYLFYSITEPGQHIVEGFGNVMPNNYDENMTSSELADLMEYLLGL